MQKKETEKCNVLEDFEKILNYNFKDISLLKTALTHSSFANEAKEDLKNNERLEFLGDAVLSVIVSEHIFKNYPDLPEGKLSKLRASLVCEKTLCKFSKDINVGSFLLLSHGEQHCNGACRESILADAFEAVIAAIYLDGGLEEARSFILRFIKHELLNMASFIFDDYKTILQEIVQKNKGEKITYSLMEESGPAHNRLFKMSAQINSNVLGIGTGKSKKQAEQMAAKEVLKLMGY